ncbi:GNAT family N-acetyltransferase [Metabacillus idriensis]|nr:GNAT family N-acetyltransferase [Metabacillus idriensis]MCM3596197.1 GNAT family N-acetyltransferase [Metabacillus idriensis]
MVFINEELLSLVLLNKNDISDLFKLSNSIGWDYDEKEIATIMRTGKIYGHKNCKGKVVSSAAIITYDTKAASIGMVIVDKAYRGLGLAKDATLKCIDSVPNTVSIMLIATEEGIPLYEKIGFKAINSVHKYLCENYKPVKFAEINGITLENFSNIHFNCVINIDEKAFGARRSSFLYNRIIQSENCIVAKDYKNNVIGYGAAISGPENLILGPIVAPDNKVAALLVNSLASRHQGKLRIDVPSGKEEFMIVLQEMGFMMVNNPPIMIINSPTMPLRNNTLFGIAAQVFG